MKKFENIEQLIFPENTVKQNYYKCNFCVGVNGKGQSMFEGRNTFRSSAVADTKFVLQNETYINGKCIKNYASEGAYALGYTVEYEFFKSTSAVRQTVTVTNTGEKPCTVTHLSSAEIDGFGSGGLLPLFDKNRFIVQTCRSAWQGEGQWAHNTLSELGLVPTTTHSNMQTLKLYSKGSWTTCRYYPVIIL